MRPGAKPPSAGGVVPGEEESQPRPHPRGATGTEALEPRRARTSCVEIISWLDDHSRDALCVTAHPRITGAIVLATFRKAYGAHGIAVAHSRPRRGPGLN